MNDNLQRLKPREKPDLPPRLFRQLLNPFEQNAYKYGRSFSSREFNQFFSNASCVGHYFDEDKKQLVSVDLGSVTVFSLNLYRAAPSSVNSSPNFLSRIEGAALCKFSAFEHRPQRSEDGAESAENVPGTYVIPGQVLTG